MLTYVLLFSLIAIVILGVIRASKHHRPDVRPQKEPFVGASSRSDSFEETEIVGKPRVIGHNPEWSPKFIKKGKKFVPSDPKKITPMVHQKQQKTTHTKNFINTNDTAPRISISEQSENIKPASTSITEPTKKSANDLIVVNVIAEPSTPYRGYELLQSLLALGLRYGKWEIFHYHQEPNGNGSILFSLASISKPGSFDLAKMGSFSTPGLAFFMPLDNLKEPLATLELLLKTAYKLTKELGGTICDEKRIPLDAEKVTEWYAKINALTENQV